MRMNVTTQWKEMLKNKITTEQNIRYVKATQVFHQVRHDMRRIRRKYKSLILHGSQNEFDRVFSEHYYLFEREGKALLKSGDEILLPCAVSQEMTDILSVSELCMKTPGFTFSTSSVLDVIELWEQIRPIKNFELEFIPSAIKAAAIHVIAEQMEEDSQKQEFLNKSIETLFAVKSLRLQEILKEKNHLHHILTKDPDNSYSYMNEMTQNLYRYKLCMTAIRTAKDEQILAQEYLDKSSKSGNQHVGFLIYKEYNDLFVKKTSSKLYFPLLVGVPALVAAFIGIFLKSWWLPFFLYFLLWAVFKPMIDTFCLMSVRSEYLPRMELNGCIPEKGRTLITITTLLPNAKEMDSLKSKLEKIYMTNKTGDVKIILLADLKESKMPEDGEDELLIRLTKKLIQGLNQQYHDSFMLLVRKRSFSKTQQVFTGKERKRGAINTLIEMIMGKQTETACFIGNREYLRKVKYLYVLDYDTKALMETAEELVAVAMHPLNRPQLDESGTRVIQGYGIFAPRIGVDLKDSLKTPFAKVMGGLGGISAYEKGGGDLYQDLFGEGIFAGKGLIDVPLFYRLLNQKFPDEVVLSHDILEGGYLRTAFVSDVELLDGFPQSAESYYKRLHRWIRGDYQNIPFLFPTIQTLHGKEKNTLNGLSRFKLFDNLRRELTPFLALHGLLLALFINAKEAGVLTAASVLSVCSGYLFGLVWTLLSGGFFSLSRKYYSKTLPQSFELISQCGYELILLPKSAVNVMDAAVRAIYRRFISHKKLMEWTTAAQTERKKNGVLQTILTNWYTFPLGILFIWVHGGFLRLLGLLFLAAIPLILYSQRRYPEQSRILTDRENDTLLSAAALMWNFYQDFVTEKENWLPPDNVQEAPVYHIAHRTSPTNIGMMLLSTLAARDMGFIDTPLMAERIFHTLNTVEKMEKFHGNLYNWYNTRTLQVLEPRYVSTVDSGNLACCLVALKEGILEYSGEMPELHTLAEKIQNLVNKTDLSVFYDENKRLFSIGYDSCAKKLSESSYDMLMSEARMTSYFAIAKKLVPLKHWEALGRTLAKSNFYTGPLSWTGTMFEYFMPELLLHCVEGSLGYEGLKFCLYCQKRRARQKGVPFGISESGYYAFDAQLNYQYQAFGVQKLALKKGQNLNTVVSPYASFLALPYDFDEAYQNLAWLKKIGVTGKYGFYEAIDFTPARVMDSHYQIVKSYMAHHVGMSLLAICNTLNRQAMQKRFLRDREMNRANELLQEKVIAGSIIYKDIDCKDIPQRSSRESSMDLEYANIYPQSPRVCCLSNGEITSILTDSGSSTLKYQDRDLTRHSTDLLRRPLGIFAYVKSKEKIVPFSYAPDYDNRFEYQVKIGTNTMSYLTSGQDIQTGMKVALHPVLPCEQRQLAVRNDSQQKMDMEWLVYLEPVLAKFQDDNAHPAFSKLFVSIRYDEVSNTLIASRRERESREPVYMAIGFLEDVSFSYEASRENVQTRPKGIFSLTDAFKKPFSGSSGIPDSCISMKWKSVIPPKGQQEYTLLISAGRTESQAVNGIITMRSEGAVKDSEAARSALPNDSIEGRIATGILPQILYGKHDSTLIMDAISKTRQNRTALWQYGISGDLPIILVELQGEKEAERVINYISCQKRMNMCHIEFDLVFSYQEEKSYLQPVLQMIRNQAEKLGQGGMFDSFGGIHAVNTFGEEQTVLLLRAAACHIAPKSMVRISKPEELYTPVKLQAVEPQTIQSNGCQIPGAVFSGKEVTITGQPKLPWCHMLATPAFGTLLSDKSLGYTWAINARENKLTPWNNDTMSDNQGEMLILHLKGKYYNLTNGAVVTFSPSQAVYRGKVGAISFVITVSVEQNSVVKNISVSLINLSAKPETIEIAYYTEPILGVDRTNAKYLISEIEENMLMLHNRFSQNIPSGMGISADTEGHFVCSRTAFWSGRWNDRSALPAYDPCGAMIIKKELPSAREETVKFILGFSASETGLKEVLNNHHGKKYQTENKIKVKTPDETLNYFMNTWLPWQISASRIFGRTAFYQCGGAWGFRDQLQDAANLAILSPKLLKTHIVRAAASQFMEGDVLHWWHNLPQAGKKGVRTRCSDDLLWLVYAVCEYVEKTGDVSLLDIPVSYAEAPVLEQGENERYFSVSQTKERETVYQHCMRAIQKAYRLGNHQLVLMGCGDWNDGYNQVGTGGKGESVWLTQFLAYVMKRFSNLCLDKDREYATQLVDTAQKLLAAVDRNAWDGEWYLRAYYDDGQKMGSQESDECQIDSLTQSFSVIAGMPDKDRVLGAMKKARELLVDDEHGIIRLFSPAFSNSLQEPGYVKAYPTGLRENGGQYTHAAVWFAMAFLMLGDGEEGYRLLQMINPAWRYQQKTLGMVYQTEPYYITADVYTNPGVYGRGGWSIYTGAAGWYYKTVLEYMLGIQIRENKLYLNPVLPSHWHGFTASLKIQETTIELTVKCQKGEKKLYDNSLLTEYIPMDGKLHQVELEL